MVKMDDWKEEIFAFSNSFQLIFWWAASYVAVNCTIWKIWKGTHFSHFTPGNIDTVDQPGVANILINFWQISKHCWRINKGCGERQKRKKPELKKNSWHCPFNILLSLRPSFFFSVAAGGYDGENYVSSVEASFNFSIRKCFSIPKIIAT